MTQHPGTPSTQARGTRSVILAFVLALLAVILTNLYIANVRRQVERESFVAYTLTRSMLPGDKIRKADVKEILVPRSFEESFKLLGAIDDTSLQIRLAEARPLERSAAQGDILRFAHFNAPEDTEHDRDITAGKRRVSLPVNARTVPGALRAGMYVDIEAAFNTGGGLPEVLTVIENVQIKAVGTRTITDESSGERVRRYGAFNSISIEVEPQQATELSMIERIAVGEFELHIRNPSDKGTPKIRSGGINPEVLDLIEQRRLPSVTPGKRSVTLPVNARTVPGNLRPGMYVDVAAPIKNAAGSVEVMTVIERVPVVAVGTRTADDQASIKGKPLPGYQTVTIEVNPDDAANLAVVRRATAGDFELRLRSGEGDTTPRSSGVSPAVLDIINKKK